MSGNILTFEDDPKLMSMAVGSSGRRRRALWGAICEARLPWLQIVHNWREALVADGWDIEPTYNEPIKHAWTARKDGFVVMGLARPISNEDGKCHKPELSIWGPDKLAIGVPETYSMEVLMSRLRHCPICGKQDVDTERVAFANRVCTECRPSLAEKLERPGWTS